MFDPNFYPNIPIGYVPYLNKYLNPGRPLWEDPISSSIYAVRIEGINEDILCASVDGPEVRIDTYMIKQNNSPVPVYVPGQVTLGAIQLEKAVGVGKEDTPRPFIPLLTEAFDNWVTEVRNARQTTNNPQGSYRKAVWFYLFDASKTVAAAWVARGCIPVSYTPFGTLSGLESTVITEKIILQPEGFERLI